EICLPFVEQASGLRGQDARSTVAKLAPHSTSVANTNFCNREVWKRNSQAGVPPLHPFQNFCFGLPGVEIYEWNQGIKPIARIFS
ncbi:MAG: hypothetical protein WCA35_09255, partial [Kovacikia sp.]